MVKNQISNKDKELNVKLLRKFGEQGLYKKAVGVGMMQAAINHNYDIEILNLSNSFLTLFRRTGNEDYATISRVLRRTAHTLHRQLLRQKKKNTDPRFLTLI